MSNNREEMIKAAKEWIDRQFAGDADYENWRGATELADFAAEQVATQTAELKKQVAEAEAFINGLERDARRTAHNSSYAASRAEAWYLLDQIEEYRAKYPKESK